MNFGELFKRFLLKSEFATLSEFGDVLASHGYAFDESTFSRWQRGNRIPKSRTLLVLILHVFITRGGITSLSDANVFLESSGQGYLTDIEATNLTLFSSTHIPFQAPQIIAYFTGRNSYLHHIKKLLQEEKIVLLHGPPGIGKTALAITFSHQFRHHYPDGVLWCRLDTSSIMDILATIAYSYGKNVNHIKNVENRASTVRSLLAQKKFLMILDNAESHHDLRLLLPNSPTASALITSRYRDVGDSISCQSIALDMFTESESLGLFRKILGLSYMKNHRQKLITASALVSHLPLAVSLLAKQLARTPQNIAKLIDQLKKEGIPLERLIYEDKNLLTTLQVTCNHLPPVLANVFTSLSVFEGRDFPLPAIAFMHGLSTEKTERLMEQLINFSLVEYSTKGKYRVHPFIKQFLQSKPLASVIWARVATYYEQFLVRGGRGVTKFYPAIEEELENILGVFSGCYKRKRYHHVIELWEFLGVFLWDTGRWNNMKRYGGMVCVACQRENNNRALALCLLRELCWLHYWQGDIKTAEVYAHRGVKLAKILNDDALLALAWTRLGKTYLSKRRARKALLFFQRALAYFRKIHNREKQGDILTYIGETYWLMGQRKKAKYYLFHALWIVNAIHDIQQKITIVSRLGCIALQEKLLSRAITYFKQSLLLEQESGRRVGDTFWNNLALGLAYEIKSNYETAKEKFQLAKEEMTLIGFTEKILRTDVFPMIFKKELTRSKFYASPTHSS